MEEVIKNMTSYKEFKKFCNEKACNGSWNSIDEVITCLDIIKQVDKIKVKKGLFKKKATEKAREDAFNQIKEVM